MKRFFAKCYKMIGLYRIPPTNAFRITLRVKNKSLPFSRSDGTARINARCAITSWKRWRIDVLGFAFKLLLYFHTGDNTPTSAPATSNQAAGLSSGAVAGMVLAIICLFVIVVGLVIVFVKQKGRINKLRTENTMSFTNVSVGTTNDQQTLHKT